MKIAIQGHPTRGKEVIRILEGLGATSYRIYDKCNHPKWYWYINENKEIICDPKKSMCGYKLYTLEEFEKEFPFKVGDRVISLTTGLVGTIIKFSENGVYHFKYDNGISSFASASYLKLYKEMKEERNITLTLDKAKEWYKKGGELKEVALQAYSEEELTKVELPKTWEEFCINYPIQKHENYIGILSIIESCGHTDRCPNRDKNMCPSKESAEAHLAMIQLEQLRDCWRQGWVPKAHESVYAIKFSNRKLDIYQFCSREFLSFRYRETAEEFFECFRDLIEKAGDLI